MLLIGTLLPEVSEEEAGRQGAALGPVGHFSGAAGILGPPHSRGSFFLQNGWNLRGGASVDRRGRSSWEGGRWGGVGANV